MKPLRTARLSIRTVQPADWESIRRIWLDFELSPFSRYDAPHDTSKNAVKRRVFEMAADSRSLKNMYFCVMLHEAVIGTLEAHDMGCGIEIGYCFHSAYHGFGYAGESCAALMAYFRTRGAKRFTAGTELQNTPSVRLLYALGFAKVGEERLSFYKDERGNDIEFDGGIFEKTALPANA